MYPQRKRYPNARGKSERFIDNHNWKGTVNWVFVVVEVEDSEGSIVEVEVVGWGEWEETEWIIE